MLLQASSKAEHFGFFVTAEGDNRRNGGRRMGQRAGLVEHDGVRLGDRLQKAPALDGDEVGALTLGINSGAYVSEIIRGGLMAVDPGQMEAGRSLGLNYMTTMVVIIIPQAIRAVLPALGNEFIVLLKDTSLITTIGGKELLYAAQGIMNRTYEAMFPLLGVALIYLILVMLFTWLLSKFERRLAQSDR